MAATAQPTDFVSLDRSFATMLTAGENVRQQLNGLSRLPQVEQSSNQILQELRAMAREMQNLNAKIDTGLERMDTRLERMDTRLSGLETNVATIQTDVATMQTTMQIHMTNNDLHLEAQDHNQVARMINAARATESTDRPLEKIRNNRNIPADGFPELFSDLRSLTNHAVGRLLRFYNVNDQGSHADKVARFAMFCGILGMRFSDSW